MSYELHPCCRLVRLFIKNPWQGMNPHLATFLFVGLDANYKRDIHNFSEIWPYLENPVKFWKEHDLHHPFLLSKYHGDGKLYHNNFAKIGFNIGHAEQVSFVELLDVPTVGRRLIESDDLSDSHMAFLNNIFDEGKAKYIFLVGARVRDLMQKTNKFKWLGKEPPRKDDNLIIWRRKKGQTIFEMFHLSCYGWQKQVLDKQIAQIRKIVEAYPFN